jgi:hypothetical protein
VPTPLNSMPCDADHPFPIPPNGAWTDSVEFGEPDRRPVHGPVEPTDVDPSPTWRALAAWIWGAPCLRQHIDEIASDTIRATHLLAAAILPSKSREAFAALNISHIGWQPAIDALGRRQGLAPGHRAVQKMTLDDRGAMVGACLSLILRGHTSLQLDLEGQYRR